MIAPLSLLGGVQRWLALPRRLRTARPSMWRHTNYKSRALQPCLISFFF